MSARPFSIRLRLLIWMIVPLTLMGALGGSATYFLAWVPARNAYDLALANIAWQFTTRQHEWRRGMAVDIPVAMEMGLRAADRFDRVFFAIHDRNHVWLAGDRGLPLQPVRADIDRPTFYDAEYGALPVRVVAVPMLSAGELVFVRVAETTSKRDNDKRRILFTIIAWGGGLAVVIISLSWLAVSQGLWPLERVKEAIGRRSLRDLTVIDESRVPGEIRPLILAVNGLLQRIEQASRLQQTFLTDIAHQLRTPLAGLLTQLAVAEQHITSPELHKSIEMMQNTADRAVRLANQLLLLARVENDGFANGDRKRVDIANIVRHTGEVWMKLADQKHIDLRYELSVTPVWGDEFLLRELLDNLLINAMQYTPVGGEILVACRRSGKESLIVVEDNGPGIPEAERGQVFNRFYRASGTNGGGSGLGLTIAWEIVLAHDGSIHVSDALAGKGARFEVRLPTP